MVALVYCKPPTGDVVQSPSFVLLQVYPWSVSYEQSHLPFPPTFDRFI